MKKVLVSLLILLLLGGAVFYFGWVQFAVPVGSYGVLLSKTSGVYPKPIVSGKFLWRWERLLPTNTQLRIFSLDPITLTDTFSSTLPSAQLYSTRLEGEPDFSYSVTVSSTARVRVAELVNLVEENNIQDQAALETLVRDRLHQLNIAATSYLLEQTQHDTTGLKSQTITTQELVENTPVAQENPWLEVLSAEVSDVRIPDASLYLAAKNAYLNSIVEGTGAQGITDSSHLSALVNLGEILTKYPALSDYMTSGDAATILELLSKDGLPPVGVSTIPAGDGSSAASQDRTGTTSDSDKVSER